MTPFSCLRELEAYLAVAYTATELTQLADHWPTIGRDLRTTLSLHEICEQLVAALHRHGLVDDELFDLLEEERPRRGRTLRPIRRAYALERWLHAAPLARDEVHPGEELGAWLVDAFNVRELVRFARRATGAPFVRHLLTSDVPLEPLADRLVAIWQVEGALDEAWFDDLLQARPFRRTDMDRVRDLVLAPVSLDQAQTARQRLAGDVTTVLQHVQRTSDGVMADVLASPLGEDRTRALVGWLCRRDALAWELELGPDRQDARLRVLRGLRSAVPEGPREAFLEPLLPRPHTRIFLSYGRDGDVTHATVAYRQHLEALGYAVFIDEHAIETTTDWRRRLLHELRRCDLLVAVVTPDYWASPFCQQEIGGAYALGKAVVMFGDGTVPQGFASAEQCERIPAARWTASGGPALGEWLARRTAAIHERQVREGSSLRQRTH